MVTKENRSADLLSMRQRVRQKIEDYGRYDFSKIQNDLLKCFYDLAQEYESLHDLYRICVAVPLELLGVDSELYLLDDAEKCLELVCTSREGIVVDRQPVPTGIHLCESPYVDGDAYVVPIYRKPLISSPSGAKPEEATGCKEHRSRIMGILAIRPAGRLSEGDRFFFTKLSNRIGYQLHNRFIARQNIEHLKFINSLVVDIEHNVIIPNMYFKHLFNQLRARLTELDRIARQLRDAGKEMGDRGEGAAAAEGLRTLWQELMSYHGEMEKHHANVSLFLESLFRREHFERGHLVLRPKRCLVEKEVIRPQLEHYGKRLRAGGITVDRPTGMDVEEIPIMVDVGLLSQVYANLFSNAVKYTEAIIDETGRERKAIAYGREVLQDCFGPSRHGIKFNVFTTGPQLTAPPEEVFAEGWRGPNCTAKPGTGHGLAFIRHVIELHGGRVGYEPTRQGNNFYFILPLPIMENLDILLP